MKHQVTSAAFISVHHDTPWWRQIARKDTVVNGVKFFADPATADVVVVYDALPSRRLSVNPDAFKVFVCSEPPNVKRYLPRFLAQFDLVLTTDRETDHPNRLFTQVGLPWHVGLMTAGGGFQDDPLTLDQFEAHFPVKSKRVSVVCSDKAFTEEHRARLAFVARLREEFGDDLDVFGRGINDFDDKRDVLDAYRYHIALENCSIEDYWTEKLADPFLTLTFPIYHGCTNIHDYFSGDALRCIDITKPEEAMRIIRAVIDSDLAERNRDALLEARAAVLNRHNIFNLIAALCEDGRITPGLRGAGRAGLILAESSYSPVLKRILGKAVRVSRAFKAFVFAARSRGKGTRPGPFAPQAQTPARRAQHG